MIGCDIDGTLLNYYSYSQIETKFNAGMFAELERLNVREVTLITNQGGLPFSYVSPKYPTPKDFIDRLNVLCAYLAAKSISVNKILVCVYHPKAKDEYIYAARKDLQDIRANVQTEHGWLKRMRVFWASDYRKPSPKMLQEAGISVYYGDSDEDRQAAEAANIDFVRVERFV